MNHKEDSHINISPPLTTKITGKNNHFSLISLNINELNYPLKRHRLTDWICKQDPTFCCIEGTYPSDKDRHYLRVKGWKTIFQANTPKDKAGVTILISNKIDFQPKVPPKIIRRDTSYLSKVNFTKMNSQF
jgi:exonuclease III